MPAPTGFANIPAVNIDLSYIAIPALLLGARLALDRIDRSCIRGALRSAGVSPLSIRWAPFGYGSNNRGRTYEVWYKSSDGVTASIHCETSLFGGLFWAGGTPPSFLAQKAARKPSK